MGKCLETESPLKMMKNAFHLKYSSRSHYGILFPWVFGHVETAWVEW